LYEVKQTYMTYIRPALTLSSISYIKETNPQRLTKTCNSPDFRQQFARCWKAWLLACLAVPAQSAVYRAASSEWRPKHLDCRKSLNSDHRYSAQVRMCIWTFTQYSVVSRSVWFVQEAHQEMI